MEIDRIRMLLVEDDAVDRMAFERFIQQGGFPYHYDCADSLQEAKQLLSDKSFDIVVSDYQLGDGTCLELLTEFKDAPIIVVTGTGDERTAVQAMKEGAGDYLIKDPEGNYLVMLPPTVKKVLEQKRAQDELSRYQQQLELLVKERTANLEAEIQQRKQIQKEREKLIVELEARNAELERFTYTVSHDLKTPLITIKGYLGLLQEDLANGNYATVEDDSRRISNAADTMDRLLRELLELSRAGRPINPPEEVPLDLLVTEALEAVSCQILAKGICVTVSPNMPVVFVDRPRVVEVLLNLIDNAVKYMGDQPRPQIDITAESRGKDTLISVRDNGAGVDARYQEKIFGLFEQLDQAREGTGVGLALAKRIVEVHGGRIWVESEGEGCGATFCFTVPAALPNSNGKGCC